MDLLLCMREGGGSPFVHARYANCYGRVFPRWSQTRRMGKVRVTKRYRLHLRGQSPTSEPPPGTPSHASASQSTVGYSVLSVFLSKHLSLPQPVPPLPKEVMERLPVLSLEDSQKVPPVQQKVPMKKKNRRKLRHQAWLKSNAHTTRYFNNMYYIGLS